MAAPYQPDHIDATVQHENLVLFLQFLREKRERGETLTDVERVWINKEAGNAVPRVR